MALLERTTRWQAGHVDTADVVHAVRPTISGYRAWCGAGDISRIMTEPFTLDAASSCPHCSDLVRTPLPVQRRSAD
ncbi:MAG TPA: hypothetical protein VFT67_15365 [Jatrophihabitantaceae bacterium]|nr:hypothetical protein [Jatrophihabitantaceae bacterium]